jgi:hypothetical protein
MGSVIGDIDNEPAAVAVMQATHPPAGARPPPGDSNLITLASAPRLTGTH